MLNIKFDIIFQNDHADQLTNGVEGLAMDDSSNMLSSSLTIFYNQDAGILNCSSNYEIK
jgi:hypothetical protein